MLGVLIGVLIEPRRVLIGFFLRDLRAFVVKFQAWRFRQTFKLNHEAHEEHEELKNQIAFLFVVNNHLESLLGV